MMPLKSSMAKRSRPPEPEALSAGVDNTGKALAIAYAYLNRRERTVAEVRARLQKAELPEVEIEQALTEMQEYGYLDDARYARVFAEDKRNLEQWGRERVERELRSRGVDRDLVAAAVGAEDGDSELERAVGLLIRRFPAGPGERRERERAFGVLIRKGYGSELAADAVRAWATS